MVMSATGRDACSRHPRKVPGGYMGCAGGEEKYYHRGDFLRSRHAFFERNSGCAVLEAMLTMGPRDFLRCGSAKWAMLW
jgi:hypothetical protein